MGYLGGWHVGYLGGDLKGAAHELTHSVGGWGPWGGAADSVDVGGPWGGAAHSVGVGGPGEGLHTLGAWGALGRGCTLGEGGGHSVG